jgi:hypothetical protein
VKSDLWTAVSSRRTAMQQPRMTTLRWMVTVAAAEALFSVMYWLCCDSELWGYIVLGSALLGINGRHRQPGDGFLDRRTVALAGRPVELGKHRPPW